MASGKIRFKPWTCDDCQKRSATGSQPTTTDGATSAEAEAPAPNVSAGDAVPSTQTDKRKSDAMFECSFCERSVHASQVCKQGHHNTLHGQTRCRRCARPTCEVCGKEQKDPLTIQAIGKYKTGPDAPWCYADPNPRLEQTSPRPNTDISKNRDSPMPKPDLKSQTLIPTRQKDRPTQALRA